MYINELVNITTRAWALPILWSLQNGVPGRQAPLLKATGAGRTAFAQSMKHLIEVGLVERNPGHGHPLRPEFRLTSRGKEVAEFATQVQNIAAEDGLALIRKSWTLPVIAVLSWPMRFNDIQRQLAPITDRALSQALKSLEDQLWVRREVDEKARPPRSIYVATGVGRELSKIIASA